MEYFNTDLKPKHIKKFIPPQTKPQIVVNVNRFKKSIILEYLLFSIAETKKEADKVTNHRKKILIISNSI